MSSYFANQAFSALRIVEDSGFDVKELGRVVQDIFILGRFRRIYATNKEAGWPYLSASEALMFRPVSDHWIARDYAPKEFRKHFAQQEWILVSCSGSVGRSLVVTKRLEKYFLTHDLARIIPDQMPLTGYVYAFLTSWIGQALLSKDQYGSAIKHLEAHHIASVSIPILPEEEQRTIHNEIMHAFDLRDEANEMLDEAEALLHSELRLPRFDESLVPYLTCVPSEPASFPGMPHPRAFTIKSSDFDERMDASYHIPVTRTVRDILSQGKYPLVRLGQLAEKIIIPPRFKRIYVSKEHGVPFLRPSHLPQMRFYDLGYISKLTEVLGSLQLKEDDILVTTDGTVGRISLVTRFTSGWSGSNNIARITYNMLDGCNGYLAAFLESPYGFYQLTREIYGGVVDHIEVPNIEQILVPDAPLDIQVTIGQRVLSAFQKKDEAAIIEEAAIRRVEAIIEKRG